MINFSLTQLEIIRQKTTRLDKFLQQMPNFRIAGDQIGRIPLLLHSQTNPPFVCSFFKFEFSLKSLPPLCLWPSPRAREENLLRTPLPIVKKTRWVDLSSFSGSARRKNGNSLEPFSYLTDHFKGFQSRKSVDRVILCCEETLNDGFSRLLRCDIIGRVPLPSRALSVERKRARNWIPDKEKKLERAGEKKKTRCTGYCIVCFLSECCCCSHDCVCPRSCT